MTIRRMDGRDPRDRVWLRGFLDVASTAGLDLHPIADDLGCEPTRESVLATLDLLDGAS